MRKESADRIHAASEPGNEASFAVRVPTEPQGLTEAEAAVRLTRFGPNELPSSSQSSIWRVLIRVLQEPMLLLLLGCGVIYLISGEANEGILLFASAVFVIGITLYQEVKSERALEALKDLSSPRALVIREGTARRIPGREVVPGDLVRVSEGDRIPADAVLVAAAHLSVDESILTGESFSVSKQEAPAFLSHPDHLPGQEHRLYSGTLVVSGQGLGRVHSTGAGTELGRIGRSLESGKDEATSLQKELGHLVRILGTLAVLASVAISVLYGITRGNWMEGILAGLASAMSLLPEEFPVVMTIFMALGAWRLARKNVLTRRVAAIESLGSISALCVDKTGTLTQNRMQVRKLVFEDTEFDLQAKSLSSASEPILRLLETAALASHPTPFDPMEKAIHSASEQVKRPSDVAEKKLIRHYPISSGLLATSYLWQPSDEVPQTLAMKGAPETVLALCNASREKTRAVLDRVNLLASQGMRILGVAKATFQGTLLPEDQQDFELQFVGLVALEDPIRPEVPGAVSECRKAGIRVIMLTGDYPATARSIARQIGISEDVMTGQELARLDDLALRERARTLSIFARVTPDQKLRIIEALKACGERIAMTGDGVNDAPSLKWADIGVAMGGRGTDVAREASDIVLLDDRFTSLVSAIHQGRRIYENLKKAISFVLAVHVPIAGLAILPVVMGLPLLLLPAHIVFLELIIDPACGLVYEAEDDESGLMTRPPRSAGEPLVTFRDLAQAALQGAAILLGVLGLFTWMVRSGQSAQSARLAAFVSLVLSNLALILVDRSSSGNLLAVLQHKNRVFNWISAGALLLLLLVVSVPSIRELFAFRLIELTYWLLALTVGLFSLLACSLVKKHFGSSRAG